MNLKESFNKVAHLYNEARTSYPIEVIDWIITQTGISTEDKLLEIAPGTGQATKRFSEKGYNIHCVELGDELAKILMDNCIEDDVTVDVSPFEEWQNDKSEKFQLIYCATAFHWIDPSVKYRKCYDLLNNNGQLVLIWHVASSADNPIIDEAYKLLWSYYPEREEHTKQNINIKEERKNEILGSKLFTLNAYLDHKWMPVQSRERFIKGFYSQSSYIALEETSKQALTQKLNHIFKRLDEQVASDFSTTVYICNKIDFS